MKVLLFITGHSQLHEYNYFNKFLQQTSLKCDIFIYCNNASIAPHIVKYYQEFPQTNKQLFITTLNSGYRTGGMEAMSRAIQMGVFHGYDYVIHLHPDVFLTESIYLNKILYTNLENDTVFFMTRYFPDDPNHFSSDFFIFKPRLLTVNIFFAELYTYTDSPEHYLYHVIKKYNVKHQVVKRFDNDNWSPRRIDDHLKLYHEHDLELVKGKFIVYLTFMGGGLGDKLMDLMGLCVMCKYIDKIPGVGFNRYVKNYVWGTNFYDTSLFSFGGGLVLDPVDYEYTVTSPNASISLSPYFMFNYLKQLGNLTLQDISESYRGLIKPSRQIVEMIPVETRGAYGIHLRKSDKIITTAKVSDLRNENSLDEFYIIMNALMSDVKDIVSKEPGAIFLVVSEDTLWKFEIMEMISKFGDVKFIKLNYTTNQNTDSVLDLFALSQCKEILQGVKYSTFSMTAAIIGNCKLRNYAHFVSGTNLVNAWNSVIEINGQKASILTGDCILGYSGFIVKNRNQEPCA